MTWTTRPSLLRDLRNPDDHLAWERFCGRYGDLVLRYALARGLQLGDAEDVRQQVTMNLLQAMPGFHYDRKKGRFRDYLARVTHNAIARRPRSHETLLPDLETGDLAAEDPADDVLWRREWMQHHYREAMARLAQTHDAQSLRIFAGLVAGNRPATVAREFQVKETLVRKVKQRVRERLRALIDEQIRREDGRERPA